MWWWFEKLEENKEFIVYAYSRESYQADGRIEINKKTEEIQLMQPCAEDADSSFAQRKAREKSYWMIMENYPDRRQIACG